MMFFTVCLVTIMLLVEGTHGYSVVGNKIHDPNGKEIILKGVDRCSFEWSATGQFASLSDYQLMAAWGSNVVRLPMNQDFWLSGASTYAPGYKATIDQQVQWIKQCGMAVILDLHWSDQGNFQNSGAQQCMPDSNSITFWTEVATIYQDDTSVMFELYNEPNTVSWDIWLNGGTGCGYTTVGMQAMYNAVRATGAQNLVIIGGLNWAFDLSGVGSNPVNGTNIAYATHPYDSSGKDSTTWQNSFGYLTPTYPVIATEFGQFCNNDDYVQDLLTYMTDNGMHWTAWAWWVSDCSFPSIISDWNGTPSPGAGVLVQQALGGNITGTLTTATGGTSTSSGSGSTSGGSQPAGNNNVVYTSSLTTAWSSYGWASDLSFTNTTYLYPGTTASLSFAPTNWDASYLHCSTPFDVNSYASLQFYINGGSAGGQLLKVIMYDNSASPVVTGNGVNLPSAVQANTWVLETIPTSLFGIPSGTLTTGFAIQDNTGSTQSTVYISSIQWVAPVSGTTATTGSATTSSSSSSVSGSSSTSGSSSSSSSSSTTDGSATSGDDLSTTTTTSPKATTATSKPDHIVSVASTSVSYSNVVVVMLCCIVLMCFTL